MHESTTRGSRISKYSRNNSIGDAKFENTTILKNSHTLLRLKILIATRAAAVIRAEEHNVEGSNTLSAYLRHTSPEKRKIRQLVQQII